MLLVCLSSSVSLIGVECCRFVRVVTDYEVQNTRFRLCQLEGTAHEMLDFIKIFRFCIDLARAIRVLLKGLSGLIFTVPMIINSPSGILGSSIPMFVFVKCRTNTISWAETQSAVNHLLLNGSREKCSRRGDVIV